MVEVGQVIGNVTILEKGPDQGVRTVWRCLCSCGNEVILSTNTLTKDGYHKSCGCTVNIGSGISLLGNIYGKLKVISKVGRDSWRCLCSCGNTVQLETSLLMKYHRVSCGCSKDIDDLTARVFGRLVVVEYLGIIKRKANFRCMCSCGSEVITTGHLLRKGKSISCGCSSVEKWNEYRQSNIGKIFGNLTIISEDRAPTKNTGSRFLCRCSCGVEKVYLGSDVRQGRKTHCGCLTIKPTKSVKIYVPKVKVKKSLVGNTYGRLTVISESLHTTMKTTVYTCLCTCGNIKDYTHQYIKSNAKHKSCGCAKIESYSKMAAKLRMDLSGTRHGKLVVTSIGDNIKDNRGRNMTTWNCLCDCGGTVNVSTFILRKGYTISCGCVSSTRKYNLKDGIKSKPRIRDEGRKTDEYRDWRLAVYSRDNYTCRCCGKHGGDINAHHLEDYENNIDKRLDIDNGVTLCITCHDTFHKRYGYFGRTYGWQFLEMCSG